MNIQYPLSWGPEVEGTPSIAALRASYAVVFFTDPSKRASARPSGRSDCTMGGIAKVCNFRPPEAVRFTSGVDTVAIERDGKAYSGKFYVDGRLITVLYNGRTKTTQLAESDATAIASQLLSELLRKK
jgi:hypothetical protein